MNKNRKIAPVLQAFSQGLLKTITNIQQFVKEYFLSVTVIAYLLFVTLVVNYNLFQLPQFAKILFRYSLGPVCICYILYRWGKPLLWLWNTTAGKLFYVLGPAVMYSACRTMADRIISSTLQTSASHFPNAQCNLTLYFLVFGLIIGIGLLMQTIYYIIMGIGITIGLSLLMLWWIIKDVLKIIVQRNPDMETWRVIRLTNTFDQLVSFRNTSIVVIDTLVTLFCGIYITNIPRQVEQPSWFKDELGHFTSFPEQILIWSSFYPNKTSADKNKQSQHLICSNLPEDINIAMANPNDFIPKEVMIVEINRERTDASGNAYSYKLSRCTNTSDPDDVRKKASPD